MSCSIVLHVRDEISESEKRPTGNKLQMAKGGGGIPLCTNATNNASSRHTSFTKLKHCHGKANPLSSVCKDGHLSREHSMTSHYIS